MSDTFTCPRRIADGRGGVEDEDTWRDTGGIIGQKGACSYCGSMHPEDFMDAARDGKEIGPTDKSYKVYVGDHEGKFYTHHLHPNHSNEFYDLVMDGMVNIGYPGHFYAKLYLPGLEPRE